MMSLQERQASMKHNISMEGRRRTMGHVHGLHKGSKALLPLWEEQQNSENNFERRSILQYRQAAQQANAFSAD
jgi:hypothetical protein